MLRSAGEGLFYVSARAPYDDVACRVRNCADGSNWNFSQRSYFKSLISWWEPFALVNLMVAVFAFEQLSGDLHPLICVGAKSLQVVAVSNVAGECIATF